MKQQYRDGLNLNLHRAVYLIDKFTNKLLRDHSFELTNSQYLVLKAVYIKDASTQKEISLLLGISETAVSKHVFKLQQKGLLLATVDSLDRRTHHIVLTEHGRLTTEEVFEIIRANTDKLLLEAMGDDGQTFRAELSSVSAALEKRVRAAA